MAKKKEFNMYVMNLHGKPYKEKMHYTIKKWFAYYHVSRELACYLMCRNGCAHIVGWNNGRPLLSLNNDSLHGCCIDEAQARRLTFCVAQHVKEYEQGIDSSMIWPNIPAIGCEPSPFLDVAVAKTFDFVIKNESKVEHSVDGDRMGAKALIPKGFYMLHTSGIEIKEGDYYWDTHTSKHIDCWTRVGNTYSRYKAGDKIGTVNWFGKVLTEPIIIRRYEK